MWPLLLATLMVGIAFAAVAAARRDLKAKQAREANRDGQGSCCCRKHKARHH